MSGLFKTAAILIAFAGAAVVPLGGYAFGAELDGAAAPAAGEAVFVFAYEPSRLETVEGRRAVDRELAAAAYAFCVVAEEEGSLHPAARRCQRDLVARVHARLADAAAGRAAPAQ